MRLEMLRYFTILCQIFILQCFQRNGSTKYVQFLFGFTVVPGGYTLWSNWTECSSTCNEGVQYRERQCINPSPQHGGKDCLTIGPATDQRSCFIAKCPGKISRANGSCRKLEMNY